MLCRFGAPRAEPSRAFPIKIARARHIRLRGGNGCAAAIKGGELFFEVFPQAGKRIRRHMIFARRSADREQTLLDLFQSARFRIEPIQQRLQSRPAFLNERQRGIERGFRRM